MDSIEIVVTVFVVAGIAVTLWWFFGARDAAEARVSGTAGVQEIDILVQGGYSPNRIALKAGVPVRLKFRREEKSSCSEQVVLSDFGIVRDLPAFETTAVEFTPDKPGEFEFTCAMNMMRGKLIVQ